MKVHITLKENSERLKNKNFLQFNGESLYKYTLLKFFNFDVYVDTDSDKIIKDIQNDNRLNHVTVYKRLDEHIQAYNPALNMLDNFFNKFVIDENEYIIITYVTSPLLQLQSIYDSINILKNNNNYDSVVSVNKIQTFCIRQINNSWIPLNWNPTTLQRTQDLEPIYEINSLFFITNKKLFKKYKNRFGINPYLKEINFPENIDIDYEKDYIMAKNTLNMNL